MLCLLLDILLVLLYLSLAKDLTICQLAVELKLDKAFALECAGLGQFLFFVVQKGVKLDNCVPLVILWLTALSYVRESFEVVLLLRAGNG